MTRAFVQVALSFSSMTMCGLIHASILKMGRSYVTEEEEAEFIHHCRDFALRHAHPYTLLSASALYATSWLLRSGEKFLKSKSVV